MMTIRKPDLELAMHRMEVVCKIAIQTKAIGIGSKCRRNLTRIGLLDFGLTPHQVNLCLGRARDLLAEVAEHDCARKKLVKFRIAA